MTTIEPHSSGEERIRDWVSTHADEIGPHLLDLVRIETPTDEPATFDRFFELLGSEFEALDRERHEGMETGGWLEVQTPDYGDDRNIQLLLGHADTVWPRGTIEHYPAGIDDDVLHGPGALDMKGGLTQLVFAMRALDALGLDAPLPVHILISSDEEIGSPESKQRIVELAQRANRVFVLEPAQGPDGKFKIARKAVGTFTITIEGKPAHAGLDPAAGASAIDELGRLIPRLNEMTDLDTGVTVNVGTIDAGLRSNVIAPEATAEVDVRAPTDATARKIEERIRSISPTFDGTAITVQGGFTRPAMERTPGNRLLWNRVQSTGHRLDMVLRGTQSGGASDGNDASQYAPTIDGFGAVGGGAHERYEYVELDALADRIVLLTACLLDEPLPEDPLTELES